MKRKIVLLGIVMIIGLGTYAQTEEKKDGGVSVGPKGGLSISKLHGSDVISSTDRTGVVIGGFVNVSFLRALSIQPEVFFSQRGGGAVINNTNPTTSNVKLSYMEIPILFKLRLPLGRTIFPHVFAGPDFAYRVNSNSTVTNNTTGVTTTIENDKFKRLSNGGVFGAGIDFQSKHIFITVDGRYGFTFNSLGQSSYNLDVHNNYITILAGIGYRFGGTK